jgi:hypothetical protein
MRRKLAQWPVEMAVVGARSGHCCDFASHFILFCILLWRARAGHLREQ